MILSHAKKFIFFKPIKVAGTSLEASFRHLCGATDLITQGTTEEVLDGLVSQNNVDPDCQSPMFHSHTWPDLFFKKTGQEWKDYKKITVCRNPWDMCVSYYWWAVSQNKESRILVHEKDSEDLVKEKFRLFLETEFEFPLPSHISDLPSRGAPVSWLAKVSKMFIHENITHYLRYESLQEDYNNIVIELNEQPGQLPRFKSSQRKIKNPYSFYYNDHTRKLVQKEFSELISFFEYSF